MLELLDVQITVKNGHYFAKCLLGKWDEKISRPGDGTEKDTS
jgi:hypothetical protein